MTNIDALQPWLVPWCRWILANSGGTARITSTRRTLQEQTALYQAYVRGESRYPANPPGQSMHERGRAFDIVAPASMLAYLGSIWQQVGGRWGGAVDPIHFEA